MFSNKRERFAKLRLDSRSRGEHESDNQGFDLVLFRVEDRSEGGIRRWSPPGAEVVFEVDSGGVADLFIDRGFSYEAEDGEGVVRVVGEFGEFGFGGTARLGLWRECVEETLREEFWIVFHDMAVFSLGFVSAGSSLGFEKLKFENWRERERVKWLKREK